MSPCDASAAPSRQDDDGRQLAAAHPGRWVRPSEAARLLGVSERTVRRRVASGQYRAERNGRNARILLPAELLSSAGEIPADGSPDPTMRALVAVVGALQEALAAERARTQRLELRLEHLEDERARLLLQVGRPGRPAAGGASAPAHDPTSEPTSLGQPATSG